MSGLNKGEGTPTLVKPHEAFDPTVVIASAAIDGAGEEELFRRYSRRQKAKQSLTFEFTREPALLQQYFRLYETECRVVDIPQFRKAEEEYNRRGHIIVVRQGNLCVGGARISCKTPRHPYALPMEIGSFRLDSVFSELSQKQMSYGEFSRLVLLEEFRTGVVTKELYGHVYRKVIALGLDMMFAAAPLSNQRMYKMNCVAVGLKKTIIHMDVELPPYPTFEEVQDYLISSVIERNGVGDNFEPIYRTEYAKEDV